MSVQKAIDLIGTGDSIQDAVTEALDRARLSLEGISSSRCSTSPASWTAPPPAYRVELRVWFTLLERLHE